MNCHRRHLVTISLLLCLSLILHLAKTEPEPRGRGSRGRGRLFDENKFGKAYDENEIQKKESSREEKLLNIFQVVRFPNDACNTTTGDQGVCYTSAECTARSGSNAGSCASGFGVCCAFSIGCGGMTSQNNTYFVSGADDTSPCSVMICMCSSDICQIRLDFDTFNIAQPFNDITDAVLGANGAADMTTTKTSCLTAQFVAGSSGTNVPIICGQNSGQHMILEADETCNSLCFTWTAATPRQWRIKTSQISCNDPNKPNEGCLQWYTGSSGTVQTFNFDGGIHLANQDQLICVRREQGLCQINWSTGIFAVSGNADSIAAANIPNNLGDMCTNDYILIPTGFGDTTIPTFERYCGPNLFTTVDANADEIAEAPQPGTVSSQITPFTLRFLTNSNENMNIAAIGSADAFSTGFQLNYNQGACEAFPT